ncbi:MAG: hydrogenase expression/formation protein HypE [Lentisphaerae bacterium]|nr:hydrogenase expression/formation protein HypE [Lentisphaerota bacterium]
MNEDIIVMGHGGGGGLTRELIDKIVLRELRNPVLDTLDDAAAFESPGSVLVMSTDSYVVDPIFFPGGDIGRLAVCGTVNDLAMQGGKPVYLTLALIIEEGMAVGDLERIIHSVATTAAEVGVLVVGGDTKVIERRSGRNPRAEQAGIFINTTGLGFRREGVDPSVSNARPGDVVVVTGTIGDHGIAIMNERENLGLESNLQSDAAPLWHMVEGILHGETTVHCLRDPTRGGVAAALCDIAESSSCGIRIREQDIPVREEVRGACAILGLDPLNVANEGKALAVVPAGDAEEVISSLRSDPAGVGAVAIGVVTAEDDGLVILETGVGGERIVTVPAGEDLPRIC